MNSNRLQADTSELSPHSLWTRHLELFRRWALHLGATSALELRVGDLHALWPAQPWSIGIAAEPAEYGQPPWHVLYIPLELYADTVAALTDCGPHARAMLLTTALGLDITSVEHLVKAFAHRWAEPDRRTITLEQRRARLQLYRDD